MDVTNPGLVSVASETYGNPDPNGGQARWAPRQLDVLVPAADEGYPPPPRAGADSSVFPTPSEVDVNLPPYVPPPSSAYVPPATEFNVDEQQIGQGGMVPVDPGNPAAGSVFRGPADYIVVGPAESFQTNTVDDDIVTAEVAAVLDADNLPALAGPSTTRYYVIVATPPLLTSYPVSLLGRQVVFAGDVTAADEGASRFIQNYGGNFLVINRDDPSTSNGNVPTMTVPAAGDTFQFDVTRQGAEQVTTPGETINVTIFPDPAPFESNEPQDGGPTVTANVSTELPPGQTIIASGVVVPTARNVSVADQSAVVGLPTNVFA